MNVNSLDPLARRPLARAPGISLSRIGFGGAPIGGFPGNVPRDRAIEVIVSALRAGMNWVDSAVLYGAGKSLRFIGDALQQLAAAHDAPHVFVTTKVGRRPVPAKRRVKRLDIYHDPDEFKLVLDYSKEGVEAAVQFSLERLKRSKLDIVFIHDPDAEGAPRLRQVLDETLPALVELKNAGLIGAVGLGMNQWEWPLLCIKEKAPIDVILCAGCYNVAEQGALELFGPCTEAGIALLNGGVYGSGLIASTARKRASYRYRPVEPVIRSKIDRFWSLCEKHSVSRHAAALQFAASPAAVTAIPLGVDEAAQVGQNLAAMAAPVPLLFWQELRRVLTLSREVPLPGGQ